MPSMRGHSLPTSTSTSGKLARHPSTSRSTRVRSYASLVALIGTTVTSASRSSSSSSLLACREKLLHDLLLARGHEQVFRVVEDDLYALAALDP